MTTAQAAGPLTAQVTTVAALLKRELRVPDYQRPYKWTIRNVAQLIEDVDTFRDAGRYRMGTIILHRGDDGGLDIVDGQQRFLTFCLIAQATRHHLGDGVDVPDMARQVIPDLGLDISRTNLVDNFKHARDMLGARGPSELQGWAEFFFQQCEVVVLTLANIDEAFQMFDSQNVRGRSLFPTDLLKAFTSAR